MKIPEIAKRKDTPQEREGFARIWSRSDLERDRAAEQLIRACHKRDQERLRLGKSPSTSHWYKLWKLFAGALWRTGRHLSEDVWNLFQNLVSVDWLRQKIQTLKQKAFVSTTVYAYPV